MPERRMTDTGIRWGSLGLQVTAAFAVMFSLGFVDNLRGALIPEWIAFFRISYSDIGFYLFISSLGYLLATFLGGLAADRWGQKKVIFAGFALLAAVILGYQGTSSFVPFVLLSLFLNAGFGFLDIGLNSLGARIFVRNSALMMNYLHLFFGLGSSAGPLFAGRLLGGGAGWAAVYLGALGLILPVFLLLGAVRFPPREPPKPCGAQEPQAETGGTDGGREETSGRERAGRESRLRRAVPLLLFSFLLAFCEVLEIGTAGWLANYLQAARGMDAEISARYLSFFFLAFTLGRAFAGAIPERLGHRPAMALFALLGAVTLGLGMLLPGIPGLLSLTGFAASILFPTVMAMIMEAFPRNSGRAMGTVISLAGVINMSFQWLIGILNDVLSVEWGFFSLLAAPAGILLFLFLLQQREKAVDDKAVIG